MTKKDIPIKLFSIIVHNLNLTYTPDKIIVLAWSKLDTGVGPSIAEANQLSKNICADLPIAPIVNKITIQSKALKFILNIVTLIVLIYKLN